MTESVETVIVGGGQAGMALSYFLTQERREHVILEKRDRPGSAWTAQRWDSFTLVTPNWTFCLPGAEYDGDDPHGFMPRSEIERRFREYAIRYNMPLRFGVEVSSVEPQDGGYLVSASDRNYRARNVVVASGLFQRPKVPAWAGDLPPEIFQLAACDYRNPQQLPPGAVLVVGSGQSGCQIAEELNEAGRKVYLCTGSAGRFPRRYRGRDVVEWAMIIGFFDRTQDMLPSLAARFGPNPQATGKNGGHTINLHQFYRDGITLLGHARGVQDGKLLLAPDMHECVAKADTFEREFAKKIDAAILQYGYSDPPEQLPQFTDAFSAPVIESLDLKSAGITAVLWTGGFAFDYSLVKLPVVDSFGFPLTQHCATQYPGLFFLGMPWLYAAKSGLLMGVGADAAYVAGKIVNG
jgi:putative flavoprotein involved in K+ transport